MKRILLSISFAFAIHGANAAEPAARAVPAPKASAAATAAPAARATAASAAMPAAKAEAAREELAELRKEMQGLTRRMAELSVELGDVGPRAYAFRYLGDSDRAMIGVVLSGDNDGVRISAVTPDGPAARAGLRGGDLITAIDGHAVAAATHDGTDRDDDEDDALRQARTLLANLKENQSVNIEYRRDGKKGVVVFNAERREALNWPALMNDDPEHPFLPKDFNERIRADVERAQRDAQRIVRDKDRMRVEIERTRHDAGRDAGVQAIRDAARTAMRQAMPWWGLNLAPVNAELGRYFGTDKGALVIAAGNGSLPDLRAGDVIVGVAGEKIERPEDVMRALRDEPPGKKVALKLMRERKLIVLDVKAPAFKSIFEFAPPPPPAPPVPPSAPVAPPPPVPPVPPAPPSQAPYPI
jgi:S1-C subfamily serine protease